MTNIFMALRHSAELLVAELLEGASSGRDEQYTFTNEDLDLPDGLESVTKALTINENGKITAALTFTTKGGELQSLGTLYIRKTNYGYELDHERANVMEAVERNQKLNPSVENLQTTMIAVSFEGAVSQAVKEHGLIQRHQTNPNQALEREIAVTQGGNVGALIAHSVLYLVEAIQTKGKEEELKRRKKEIASEMLLEDGILASATGNYFYIQPASAENLKNGFEPVSAFYIAKVDQEESGKLTPSVIGDISLHVKYRSQAAEVLIASALAPHREVTELEQVVIKEALRNVEGVMRTKQTMG